MQKKYNILFVNDSMDDNFLTSSIIELDHLPIESHFEHSPEKALQYLCWQTGSSFPDAIIADVHLPLFDGFEFAKRYRDAFYYSYPNTRFFLTSSSFSAYDRQRLKFNSVITDFLRKPFSDGLFRKHIMDQPDTISV